MLVPLNLTGGSYEHRSRPLSKQRTRNFWPQIQPNQKEQSPYILHSFYGLKDFKTFSATTPRGMFENQGRFYRVADTYLYEVASDGTHTVLGAIPGSDRCIFDAIGSDVVVVTGGNAYFYDYSGGSVALITDTDIGSPNSCTSLNNQMLYDDGSGQTFVVSDPGDPTTIFALNTADAESSPDNLVRVYAFKQTAYMMGQKTIELWWNSGQGNPPFDRIQGGIIDIGLDAIHSVAKTPDLMFFFGSDKQIHSLTGGSSAIDTVVSNPSMAYKFQNYTTTSDAIGWCMEFEGQWFYVLTFPTEDVTWVYPVGGEPFEWGGEVSGRIRANSYVSVFGKSLVEDYTTGNIYELSSTTYTDAGSPIIRVRDTAPITGKLFNAPGKKIEMSYLELIMETGVGTPTGEGVDPEVMLSWSDDGGKTYSHERRGKIGSSGQYKKVIWHGLGSFYERSFRISISDPVYCAIYSAAAEIQVGI